MMSLRLACLVAFLLAFLVTQAPAAEDAPATEAATETAADGAAAETEGDEKDETKLLLKQLTIAMASEVLDERTVVVRDTTNKAGTKKTTHLRLANVAQVPRGSLSEEDYQEKVKVAKAALQKLVDKQMMWYKAAPDNLQAPPAEGSLPDTVIADIWSIDGKHIATDLKKNNHLEHAEEFHSELGKDILTAAAEVEKKDSYKKLEEALKESEMAKKEAAKAASEAAEKEEEANVDGLGLGGWAGLAMVAAFVVGAVTNFGRKSNKKVNLNRKKGFFEKFWMKLKGA